MRPDAPAFSPSAHMNGEIMDQELAIVPYAAEKMAKSGANERKTSKPHQLVLHETVRSLITDIAELGNRCDMLETANSQLKREMQALRITVSSQGALSQGQKKNLSGYSSSEHSSSGEEGGWVHDDNEQLRIIKEAVIGQQQKIEKLTLYKLQTSALFGSLKAELEGVNVEGTSAKKSVNGQEAASEVEVVESIGDIPPALEDRISGAVEALSSRIEQIERASNARIDAIGHKMASDTSIALVESRSVPPHLQRANKHKLEVAAPLEAMEKQIDNLKYNLKKFKSDTDRRVRLERIIDDAPTKDALYRMYRQLEDALYNKEARGRSGPFHGDDDELWAYLTRVIRRMATFDQLQPAIDEAKAADIDLSDG